MYVSLVSSWFVEHVFLLYFSLLGLAVGSFLNVVIFRYHTGRGLSGRSFCPSCGRRLQWTDLIPVFSFLFLRGKCRKCRARISWQYPLVELFTGLVFFLIARDFFDSPAGFERWLLLITYLSVWPLLIVMMVYDVKHKILPDAFSYGFAGVALLYQLIRVFTSGPSVSLWGDLAAGPLLFLPFFLLWFLSKGKWMGLGDGKLALGIGWFLGLEGGISAIIGGFWLGALAGLFLMLVSWLQARTTTFTMKSEIPFGPFLIAGVFAVSFFNFSLFTLFAW